MNKVQINKVNRSLPGSWNELTRDQLIYVCSLFSHNMKLPEFKLKILFRFLGIKKKLFKKIDPQDVLFLSETFDFLQQEVTLTRALIKSIRLGRFPWTCYRGPQDGMSDCTFGEFTKAQVRFEEYARTQDPQKLSELTAILFRRKKAFWWIRRHFGESTDARERFIDRTLEARTKRFRHVDHDIKAAVLLFFSGVQASLTTQFPNVYKPTPAKSSSKSDGWVSLIISLADGKTDDQSLERVMNSNLYNVFFGLEKQSIEYFEFIKKYPDHE